LRASVRTTAARNADPPTFSGHIGRTTLTCWRRDGLRFRRVPELRINAFELEVSHHGLPANYTAEAPQRVYFDNVVIAAARIGRLSPARP
jgi:hypothetical protein